MSDPALFRLRCHFVKAGRLALLSHLEVAHALERAVRRSGLPFAVSQGFSPHMRIAFGAALPVGVGSTCEIFDLFLKTYVAPDKALVLLQQNIADDLMVQSCSYIEHTATAASVCYPVSVYRAVLSESLVRLETPAQITVVRKKKEKTLVVADYLLGQVHVQGNELEFALVSSPAGSLRPDLFVRECLACSGSAAAVVSLTRIEQRTQ